LESFFREFTVLPLEPDYKKTIGLSDRRDLISPKTVERAGLTTVMKIQKMFYLGNFSPLLILSDFDD